MILDYTMYMRLKFMTKMKCQEKNRRMCEREQPLTGQDALLSRMPIKE